MNDKELLKHILVRQDAIIDMLSSFMKVYAKQNDLAIEDIEEECEYINVNERFDK